MREQLNIYSVDSLYGDHIEYVVASSWGNACLMVNPTENITVTDIDECCVSKKVLKQIIDEELDEDEETLKKLKRRYGVYGR